MFDQFAEARSRDRFFFGWGTIIECCSVCGNTLHVEAKRLLSRTDVHARGDTLSCNWGHG